MHCPGCGEWVDNPHCPSPTCPWKWCKSCNIDVSPQGKSMKHNPMPRFPG